MMKVFQNGYVALVNICDDEMNVSEQKLQEIGMGTSSIPKNLRMLIISLIFIVT